MRLVVVSHKHCWHSQASPSGFATDGGFPFQMRALSELFDATTIVVPCSESTKRAGELPLVGHNLTVVPLTLPLGSGLSRKLAFPVWLLRNSRAVVREVINTDVVHAPIPGDVGTIGMLTASALRKRLVVRHCGNWYVRRTRAEYFWRWFMERQAGGRNVMLATGGGPEPPSSSNPNVRWVFSTSLTERELTQLGRPRKEAPRSDPKLVIACRQIHSKGTGLVIRSIPLLLKRYPEASLRIAGDGPVLSDLKNLAASMGIERRISFYGSITHDEVLDLFRSSDIFVFPTASEGFPKVVVEALACGLPVVTSRVSVLPHLLKSGAGRVLEDLTPKSIATAVDLCLSTDRTYSAMSHAAVQTARDYSLENWRDTIGVYLRGAWGSLMNNCTQGS